MAEPADRTSAPPTSSALEAVSNDQEAKERAVAARAGHPGQGSRAEGKSLSELAREALLWLDCNEQHHSAGVNVRDRVDTEAASSMSIRVMTVLWLFSR
ncbi:MAG: hypothetical protein ACR2JO_01745 [Mycobacteriales bacterium]